MISTCEHTHAHATLLALQNGKHIYCEKPLTHNIWEARKIREEAAKTKVATQMGIQMHASENYRRVVELIQGNVIGPVREVHVWVSRAWGLQSAEAAKKFEDHSAFKDGQMVGLTDRPKGSESIPSGLDWDLWLGPAPARPFHSVYVPGPKWYRWWDFGSGHHERSRQPPQRPAVLGAEARSPPTSVEAFGPPAHPEIAPASMSADLRVPRARRPARRETLLVPGREQARDLEEEGHSPVGRRRALHRRRRECCSPSTTEFVLLAGEEVRGRQASGADPPAREEPLRRVDRGVQGRHAVSRRLPVLRLADRGQPPRQRGVSRRQEADLGRDEAGGDERAGGEQVHPPRVPQGVGTIVTSSDQSLPSPGASGA